MSLKNKVVVVTGGAGFVGSHLVDQLIKEDPEKIVVIDNYFHGYNDNLQHAHLCSDLLELNFDVSDSEAMEMIFTELHPDIVFNLAVVPLPVSLELPVFTYKKNIELGIVMCDLIHRGFFETLIHFSSSEVYGTCITSPMNEDHPLNGRTTYAASKAAIDQLVLAYHHTFGIDASIIRPFNVYGPRQNMGSYAAVIPITIRRILAGKKPIICGDGNQTRDYTYVSDVVNATIEIYNKTKTRGKTINVASGKEISILQVVAEISELMEYPGYPEFRLERPGDVRKHIADISLAKSIINYIPSVGFDEGLEKTVKWYKNAAR